MELRYIKDTECPRCGNDEVVSERAVLDIVTGEIRRYSDGSYPEVREFSCGQGLRYSPISKTVELLEYASCRRDPIYAQRMAALEHVKNTLLEAFEWINRDKAPLAEEDRAQIIKQIQELHL